MLRKKRFQRPEGIREIRKTFLIVCEGKKTEPNYFNGFKVSTSTVKVFGAGDNTDHLVEEVENIIRVIEKNDDIKFDEIWCVFDRDSFPPQNFNRAIRLANNKGYKVAYTNEAFELWYLLHYHYIDSGLNRDQYKGKLSRDLGKIYEKNDPEMYSLLIDKQCFAIENAKKLLAGYPNHNPETDNPSTTVHLLVEELNKYLPESEKQSC